MRSRVIIDIETAGFPFDTIDERQQEYLLKFAGTEKERENEKLKVSLYPYTAELVCIGMLNPDSGRGCVLVQAPEGTEPWADENKSIDYLPSTESGILTTFWERVSAFQQIVTFNGRCFDAPFLHVRSAMAGISAGRRLMSSRYDSATHLDLLEQFTFHGAVRKFNLDFMCQAFGIDSPKRHGMTGLDVPSMFREGRFREIAEYNARDLYATRELLRRWELIDIRPGP